MRIIREISLDNPRIEFFLKTMNMFCERGHFDTFVSLVWKMHICFRPNKTGAQINYIIRFDSVSLDSAQLQNLIAAEIKGGKFVFVRWWEDQIGDR